MKRIEIYSDFDDVHELICFLENMVIQMKDGETRDVGWEVQEVDP